MTTQSFLNIFQISWCFSFWGREYLHPLPTTTTTSIFSSGLEEEVGLFLLNTHTHTYTEKK